MFSKGFIAVLAVVAIGGYLLLVERKKLTYEEYITREHKRLKEADSEDLNDVEKGLAASLTDDKASLESAIMLAIDTSTQQQFKDGLQFIGQYAWTKKSNGDNGWKHIAAAAELAEESNEVGDYTPILEGRIAESIPDTKKFLSGWDQIESLLKPASTSGHLSVPLDGSFSPMSGFYHIKKYALFCDFIDLENLPDSKFSRVVRILELEKAAEIPPVLIYEMYESMWARIYSTALRSACHRELLSTDESKKLGLYLPTQPSLLSLLEAEVYYSGNSEPHDGGDFGAKSCKWLYEETEENPGDIGEWVTNLISSREGTADYYLDAIKWMKSNPGELQNPEFLATLLNTDVEAFSLKQGLSFLLNWSELAVRTVYAKSIAEPVTESEKPDWLTGTPMFICTIEGDEVVMNWDEAHPIVKRNKQSGEADRFRWK